MTQNLVKLYRSAQGVKSMHAPLSGCIRVSWRGQRDKVIPSFFSPEKIVSFEDSRSFFPKEFYVISIFLRTWRYVIIVLNQRKWVFNRENYPFQDFILFYLEC